MVGIQDQTFLLDVQAGLQQKQKTLPSKYFYDLHGSELFDQICEVPEYYPTRTEKAIMLRHAEDMAKAIGPRAMLIEYGSGSSVKTRMLLDQLVDPAAYVPVDISGEYMEGVVHELCREYIDLTIEPFVGDYFGDIQIPDYIHHDRRVIYFPGSTIGNFTDEQRTAFFQKASELVGHGGGLLIGVDLKKDPQMLHAAYNDAQGVTAAFNLNLLHRINNELGGNFEVDQFFHYAFYNPLLGQIEMHIVSKKNQLVKIGGIFHAFKEGESIFTECSRKYTLRDFERVARSEHWFRERVWTDNKSLFSVQLFNTFES